MYRSTRRLEIIFLENYFHTYIINQHIQIIMAGINFIRHTIFILWLHLFGLMTSCQSAKYLSVTVKERNIHECLIHCREIHNKFLNLYACHMFELLFGFITLIILKWMYLLYFIIFTTKKPGNLIKIINYLT